MLNLGITFLRSASYAISSLLQSRVFFKKLNKSILYSNMNFFDENPNGRIINRLSSDINTLDDYLPWLLHIFLLDLSASIGFPVGVTI